MKRPMLPYRCLSPACKASGNAHRTVYVDSPREHCRECLTAKFLRPLMITHLILPDAGKDVHSKVDGQWYGFLCQKSRRGYHDTGVDHLRNYPRSFTHVPSAATCYDCLLEYGAQVTNGELKMPGVRT